MTPLRDLSFPAGSADAGMAFRFLLGRAPARGDEAAPHLGQPLAAMFWHILRSAEFRETVLPRLARGGTAPESPMDPALGAWAERVLGLPAARRWPGALAEWLRHPANLARMAEGDAALAQALGGPYPAWRESLPRLLCGPAPALPITEGNCLAAARQMILSPAWREAVLRPLAALPGMAATPALLDLAETHFLAPEKAPPGADWSGLLLHLLSHRASRLRLESAVDWFECGAAEEAALPGLIALRDAALRAGAQPPDEAETLLRHALAIRQAGDYQGAADALDRLLTLYPAHEVALERRLTFELDLYRADPLRPRARLEELLAQRRAVVLRKLALDPASPALRLERARLAIAGGAAAEGRALLEALAEARPGWAAPIAALMYLAQDEADHAGVLAAWARLPLEARGERAVIAAAKALRLSGEIEAGQALLAEHLTQGEPGIQREHARNHFFAGRFAEAAREAQAWLDAPAPDLEFGLLAMAIALEQRAPGTALSHAARLEAMGAERRFPAEFPLFRCAALTQAGDGDAGLAMLDGMFARIGARPLRRDPSLGGAVFDQLRASGPAAQALVLDGPKISVVMTCCNSAPYLVTAVRSILEQSYRNLELIIVDDASTDATPALLAEIARRDPRVRVILKPGNDGTYVSKNIGLLHSSGEFVALQDSDDWSHPDRLALSVGMLLRRPDLVALTTDWWRMTSAGEVMIMAGGQISHHCCISLIFRREVVQRRLGFFDSVRVAADLEFIQRLGLVFGERAAPRLRWPLMLGRARADSLTASPAFGLVRTGFTTLRRDYHRSADAWHDRIRAGEAEAHMPFPMTTRRFDAPPAILPGPVAG